MRAKIVILEKARETAGPVDRLPTDELLALHERLFAPLDPQGKARMLAAAWPGAGSQRWSGLDGLAA